MGLFTATCLGGIGTFWGAQAGSSVQSLACLVLGSLGVIFTARKAFPFGGRTVDREMVKTTYDQQLKAFVVVAETLGLPLSDVTQKRRLVSMARRQVINQLGPATESMKFLKNVVMAGGAMVLAGAAGKYCR